MTALGSILRQPRTVMVTGLAVLVSLAWLYVWSGAGMGMSALQMTELTLLPHAQPEPMPGMAVPVRHWLTVVTMWWVMMIAMMTPSAAPLVLLYERVIRQTEPYGASRAVILLLIGYLGVWLAFSAGATVLQFVLQRAGIISGMMLWSRNLWFSSAVLIGAGVYQLSPLKHACLRHCRGPAEFLVHHARAGELPALRLGALHGAWCVGCCWLLMTLLFVGGVMNLVWIALIAVLVLIEKVTPHGLAVSRVSGILLIAWGTAVLTV